MATDLFGRGMDIERVNIVFNYDMPENSDTYLHRVRSTTIITVVEQVLWNKCFIMLDIALVLKYSLWVRGENFYGTVL